MNQKSLTAKYRPQTFEQVAGQQAIKTILSRAAARDRIAPAYLFSGTRGVGKTTIARIFAKAINCETAPTQEPCNTCRFCDQITRGASVDVMEIDGASNTGVDNVRKLRENVAYAPLDCRYKVIIIDEAHMLSKSAFNALLKTLEEPPSHVVFIMATTEPEKFPRTIISRCQHYVFKRLPLRDLAIHLTWLLEQEAIPFESSAVNLVARRGAGSVRDAMSLLAQVLALGKEGLVLKDVRDVLGLADQELYLKLVRAIATQDLLEINHVLKVVLDNGLDLTFFLRELVLCWRNLFLLAQAGDKARALIDLPLEEIVVWQECVSLFSATHIHACWQMTLEGQRKVQTSLEPSLDLEMLLLNLAYLPSLLPLGKVKTVPAWGNAQTISAQVREASFSEEGRVAEDSGTRVAEQTVSFVQTASTVGSSAAGDLSLREPYSVPLHPSPPGPVAGEATGSVAPCISGNWDGFVEFCLSRQKKAGKNFVFLKQARGTISGNQLQIKCTTDFLYRKVSGHDTNRALSLLAREFFGAPVELVLVPPRDRKYPTVTEIREEAQSDPLIKDVMDVFGAKILDVQPRRDTHSS